MNNIHIVISIIINSNNIHNSSCIARFSTQNLRRHSQPFPNVKCNFNVVFLKRNIETRMTFPSEESWAFYLQS